MLMTHAIFVVPSIHVTTPTHFFSKPYVRNVLFCTVRVRFAFIAVAVAELPSVGTPLQCPFGSLDSPDIPQQTLFATVL